VGSKSLLNNTTGGSSTAIGYHALTSNTTGYKNTACGYLSLQSNNVGSQNTAFGAGSLAGVVSGGNNTAVGYNAYNSGDYSNATAIGYNTSISGSNQIHLGNSSITEIKGQVTFTTYSDGRVKDNIKENVKGLDFILKLRPVTYHFNVDRENSILGITDDQSGNSKYNLEQTEYSGFIAQEVEKAAQSSGYNFSGIHKPNNSKDLYGLSYAEFVVPLVKAVQEQEQKIDSQTQKIDSQTQKIEQQQKTITDLTKQLTKMKDLQKRLEKLEKKME